ncbi:MAG TPA: hypothetical protein ENN73_00745, partial [Firmicutes bacterium]|nr:hypothetical protein [Bacillota bacterium]
HAAVILSDFKTLIRAWLPHEMLIIGSPNDQIEKPQRQAEVTVETGGLDFSRVLSLFPTISQEIITGMISVRIYLESGKGNLEDLSGSAKIGIAGLEVASIPVYQEYPIEMTFKNGKLELKNFNFEGKEGKLEAKGKINITEGRLIDLEVNGDIDLNALQSLLEDGQISGRIGMSAHLSNTISEPEIKGDINLSEINFLLQYPGLFLKNLNGNIKINPEEIVIQNISGGLNGGDLSIDGEIILEEINWTAAEIRGRLTDVWIDMPMGLSSRINSNLVFTSKKESNGLTGEVWLSDTIFSENFSIQSTLYRYLQRSRVRMARPQENPLLGSLDLNMNIRTDTNLQITNNIANSELKADLILKGTAIRPSLAGRALVEQGELYFTGNTFIIEDGIIDFIDPNQIDPYLNIKARTRVNEYDILLTMVGPASNLKAYLSSDPALKQVDIISLLVTGMTLDSASAHALDIAGNEVLAYLNNAVTGRIETVVKEFFGLDSVQIDAGLIASQENPNSRLTLGQNLTRSLKLIYSQDLKDARNQTWIMDYYPYKKLNVQGIKRDNHEYSIGVKHNIAFGGKSPEVSFFNRALIAKKNKVGTMTLLGNKQFVPKIKSLLKTKEGRLFDFHTFHGDLKKIRDYLIKEDYLEYSLESDRKIKPDSIVDLTIKFDSGPRIGFYFKGAALSKKHVREIKKIWADAGTEQFA